MEIDASTYPSRTFIRFTARNQLMANLTGQTITAMVQRLGGESFVQEVTPDESSEFYQNNSVGSDPGFRLGMSLNIVNADDRLQDDIHDAAPPSSPEENPSEPDDSMFQPNSLDEALFEEIARVTFSDNRHPELYQSCGTRRAAANVEASIAAEIVSTYKEITQKQQCPIVQKLNDLL